MNNFVTGLALIAINSSAQSYGMPQQSYAPQPSFGMSQQSYSLQPGYGMPLQSYGAPYYGQYPAANPQWMTPPSEDKTGWYSPTQQYSPPYKKFVPNIMDAPVFAIANGFVPGLKIEFAQVSGHKTAVRIELSAQVGDPNQKYTLKFGTLGVCDQDNFQEFNPMTEVDAYGKANPFQDPAIGRIPSITTFEDGSYSSFEASYIEQNLLGPMGIVGRTVAIFAEAVIDDRSAEDTFIFCWVIGLVPARPAPWNGDAPKKAVEELAYEKPVGKKRRNRY